jgi:hypothetical protein
LYENIFPNKGTKVLKRGGSSSLSYGEKVCDLRLQQTKKESIDVLTLPTGNFAECLGSCTEWAKQAPVSFHDELQISLQHF